MQYDSKFAKWGSLGILSLALAIIIIDTTILNVSLQTIILDLHTDIKSIQWVITDYALILAALMITGGRLGDLFGRKKIFLIGAIIFAIGSFVASIAHSVGILLLGEAFIEGVGAALMMPATSSLIVANFRGRERATAFGIWGGVAGASAAIGPILGGWLTSSYSWRWAFRVNVGIVIVVLLGSFLIKESYERLKKTTFDWIGVILSAAGLGAVVFGLIESETYGWWSAKEVFTAFGHTIDLAGISITPIAFAIGIIIIGLFLWWEKRYEQQGCEPLVSLGTLKNSQFMSGVWTTMILTISMMGLIFVMPVFWQAVRGLNAFHTGIAGLPLSLAMFVCGPIAAVMSHRTSPKKIIISGMLVAIAGILLLRNELSITANPKDVILGLTIFGAGLGFVMAPISNLMLSALPVQRAGEASGVSNTFRQLGSSLGAAVLGAIMITSIGVFVENRVQDSVIIPELAKPALIQNLTHNAAAIEFGDTHAELAGGSPAVRNEVQNIIQQSIVDSAKVDLYYGALFMALAVLAALYLPSITMEQMHDEEMATAGKTALESEGADDPRRRPTLRPPTPEEVFNRIVRG